MTERQKSSAKTLLSYLSTKNGSTFKDDYYHHMKEQGYSVLEIEQIVDLLVLEGCIAHIGTDNYWIQILSKGYKLIHPLSKARKYNWKKLLEITGYIAGIISTLIAIYQLVLKK